MFLTLLLLIIVGIAVAAVVAKAVKASLSSLRKDSQENTNTPKAEPEKTENRKESEQKQKEAKAEQQKEIPLNKVQRNRFSEARRRGISEDFWTEATEVKLEEKTFADKCVKEGALSYLEVGNRDMAGAEFMGFNISIDENEKMTLSYNGQAVATLTRIKNITTQTVDGKETSVTSISYRTHTFPPRLSPDMVPKDLERMLGAVESIRSCGGNPEKVFDAMTASFTNPDNTTFLKENIDPKIQAKESKSVRESQGQSTKEKNGIGSHPKKMM